jgi:broad specificity phosphatase PhoE
MKHYGLNDFDGCYVSPALRSEQSAIAMNIENSVWQKLDSLDERNRGDIRGLRSEQHRKKYSDSFEQMRENPLHWVPPGGESIIDVAGRVRDFLEEISNETSVLAVTHRDWMWAAQMTLEDMDETELSKVNTDLIHNAQIVHYSSLDPKNGEQAERLLWKRSINPARPTNNSEWQELSNVEDSVVS